MVFLAMTPTRSAMLGQPVAATSFSPDKRAWRPLPPGVRVTGSTKAFVCGSLEAVDLEIDTSRYVVATGRGTGASLSSYLRFRVDKACAVRGVAGTPARLQPVALVARLVEPFAVYLSSAPQ
jgi:hypothetical protein